MLKTSSRDPSPYIVYPITFLLSLALVIVITHGLTGALHQDIFFRFLNLTLGNLYRQHHNIIMAPVIANISFYQYIYSAISLGFLCLYLATLRSGFTVGGKKPAAGAILLSLTFSAYIFVAAAQTVSFFPHLKRDFKFYAGKSPRQQYAKYIGAPYLLAEQVKMFFPGYHKAELITDLDLEQDPGALYFREMAHFLYPVDIRNIHKGTPTELVLIFFKSNAVGDIPNGYRLFHEFNEDNIIAVKE